MFRIYKKTGQARDEGVSMKRSSTSKEFKRRSSVGSWQCIWKAGVEGVKRIIDNWRRKACTRVKVLGDLNFTNMCVSYTTGSWWQTYAFLIESKSLLSSPGKMIGEQYKIIGIAQVETIRHKRDLWTFIGRSLRIKKIFVVQNKKIPKGLLRVNYFKNNVCCTYSQQKQFAKT